jgi:hypothetical protein
MKRRLADPESVVMRSRQAAFVAVVIAAGLFPACKQAAPAASHVSLSSVEPLRSAFNTDSGKVRAIFLASPT